MNRKLAAVAALTPLAIAMSMNAHAGSYVDSFITSLNNPAVCGPGAPPTGGTSPCINTWQDESRDMFADIDGNGEINAGDINFGFAQLDTRTTPIAGGLGDGAAIVAFAFEVESVTTVETYDAGTDTYTRTDTLEFKAVTNATAISYGLDLTGLTGDATDAGQMLAVYSDVGFAPLTASPGDTNADGALNVLDWMAEFGATGVLEEKVGIVEADDFWTFVGEAVVTGQGDLTGLFQNTVTDIELLEDLTSGSQISATTDFNAGLTVSTDPAGFTKEELLLSGISGSFHEFLVTGGTVSGGNDLLIDGGAFGIINPFFLRANIGDSCTGFPTDACVPDAGQGDIINIYGASNNTDVSQVPVAVPVPATLALFGVGLVGLGRFAKTKRAKAV